MSVYSIYHRNKDYTEAMFRFRILRPRYSRLRRRRGVSLSSKKQYAECKETARVLVHARLAHFNQFYGFDYTRVFMKNLKSRWGSCSKLRNLNFNYKIVFVSPELQDYLIVHELCHLSEFNHSPKFWTLVEKTIPDYVHLRQQLRAKRL